ACADPGVIGKPFFVMRRIAGTAQGREITADPALEPALPRIAERLGAELARIQTIRPPRADLAFLWPPDANSPAAQIADFGDYLDRHPNPRPVLEWGLRWAETHLPAPLPAVLRHGDFRTGNYLVEGTRLTAILDWEFAGWGDPDEDIGWFCCKGWRFARLDREAGGIAERAPFYAGYEAASGRRLDPERIRYWEIFANVRWAIIALQQSDRYLIGGARDLSTAIIGRRAGECELELLLLLGPAGVPVPKTPSPPSGERVGVRGQPIEGAAAPSPSHAFGAGPSLSRGAGEGIAAAVQNPARDLPSGLELAELGRRLLLDELLPLLPPERHREAHLVATAIAIAGREAGPGPIDDIFGQLAELYAFAPSGPRPSQPHEGGRDARDPADNLLRRFALDLRNGAFETCPSQECAARVILWRVTIARLREANPHFLAVHGIE
ncbi:MAG TPA: phosphotransferase family protein, partial [Stellaceae bacterium]